MKKILILEDETIVALDIKLALEELGFETTNMVTNYDDALQSVNENRPDILLADINLQRSIDGIETAKAIQKLHPTPIIYLTAFCDDDTINRAIETDPVGYIGKPFKKSDLKSNILLAIHKMDTSKQYQIPSNCKELGHGFYFNKRDKILYFKDKCIKLSRQEKKLLSILVEADEQVVSFRTLEHHIWPEKHTGESTLRTLLYRLRTKLEHKLIETIPGTGCILKL